MKNNQYLHTWEETNAQSIEPYLELFIRHNPAKADHLLPFVVLKPAADKETIPVYLERLGIYCDLPLAKYHLNSSADAYVSFLYVEDGTGRKGHRPSEPVGYGRGLTISEGVAMVAAWPEVLEDHAIDMISSRYSIECVPTLYTWNNRVHLSAVCPDVQDVMCGAPIVKQEIKFTRKEWEGMTLDRFSAQLEVRMGSA